MLVRIAWAARWHPKVNRFATSKWSGADERGGQARKSRWPSVQPCEKRTPAVHGHNGARVGVARARVRAVVLEDVAPVAAKALLWAVAAVVTSSVAHEQIPTMAPSSEF